MDAQRTYAKGMAKTFLLLGLMATVGCAPGVRQSVHTTTPTRETQLIVENQDWYDARVYVLRGTAKIRVGTVQALSRAVLSIPASVIGGTRQVTLLATPIGSRLSHVSESIIAPETGSLHWRLQSGLRVSWLTIRR